MLQRTALMGRTAMRSVSRSTPSLLVRGGGHHEDHTMEPPFHRLPLPNRPLHEQDELIWNDGVAPETAIDFDAPHMSATQGLLWWLGGFGFFFGVYQYAKWTNHPNNKPSGQRDMPMEAVHAALGGYGKA